MSAETNPAAFARPASVGVDNWQHSEQDGMTLRDYFAGKALQGYAANARVMDKAIDGWKESGGKRPTCVADFLAGLAYEVADSMLVERAKGKTS